MTQQEQRDSLNYILERGMYYDQAPHVPNGHFLNQLYENAERDSYLDQQQLSTIPFKDLLRPFDI